VRDLEKVTAHFLSHPQAIDFYARLRVAQGAAAGLAAPGVQDSRYAVPYVEAIKALVRTDPRASRAERRRVQAAIRDRVTSLETTELAVHAVSDELVTYDIDADIRRNTLKLGLLVFAVNALCVLALFRSRRELLLVFAVLASSCIWSFGLAGLLGMRLSFLHLLGLPILIGTAEDNSLALGARLVEERRRGAALPDALRATYAALGNAILLTSASTALGFFAAALTATAGVVASFYLFFGISMAFALSITVLLQASLRTELARLRPRVVEPLEMRRESPLELVQRFLTRRAQSLLERGARPLLLGSAALFAVALLSATRLEPELSRADVVRPGTPSQRANDVMQHYFGDFRVGYVLFQGEVENPTLLVKLERLEQRLAGRAEIEQVLGTANVESVIGLIDKLRIPVTPESDVRALFDTIRANEQTADYTLDTSFREASEYVLRKRGSRYDGLLLRFFVPGEGGSRALAACALIRREIESLGLDRIPGVEVAVGGGDVMLPLESASYNAALTRSFFLSALANAVLLALAWRRTAPALVAMLPMAFATAIVVGAMPLFGVHLNPLNLGVGAIVVGLGVDYPIHVMERFFEERDERGLPTREAAAVTLETLGLPILASMLTTVIGFAVACVLLLPMSTSFGLMTGAAILLVYLATLFVLPTLLLWLRVERGDRP
jgi:predicted RND superfamily exporter protein